MSIKINLNVLETKEAVTVFLYKKCQVAEEKNLRNMIFKWTWEVQVKYKMQKSEADVRVKSERIVY